MEKKLKYIIQDQQWTSRTATSLNPVLSVEEEVQFESFQQHQQQQQQAFKSIF